MEPSEHASGVPSAVSARSAILTLMLASDESVFPDRDILAVTRAVGVSEPTARVALSRMAAAGDVSREGGGPYSLSDRLQERRRLQRQRIDPVVTSWNGEWELAVVTRTGRSATQRAALREQLTLLRLGELREGVWMRPANLEMPWPPAVAEEVRRLRAEPIEDAADLARSLWDLDRWSARGHSLLRAIASAGDPTARFAACVASVRHLMTDPTLPDQLRPEDWPAAELRASYREYRTWLFSLGSAANERA
ncbi:MAG: PaaX family transcriptional regulator C-terminal domain-containing protein [Nocardioides sp.]|uniref:PaaX family transcriptional regulator C-terminal domain-containing protein n=1 Tax=Nocardioides sp. TaxID=35761 RepID=UPI003D6AD561